MTARSTRTGLEVNEDALRELFGFTPNGRQVSPSEAAARDTRSAMAKHRRELREAISKLSSPTR